MKSFALGLVLSTFAAVAGGITGYWAGSNRTVHNPACSSLIREERKVIDSYTFLLGRDEIRQADDRKSIEREFHDKLANAITDGVKKGCLD